MAQKKTPKPRRSAAKRLWQWIKSHKFLASGAGVFAAFTAYQSYVSAGADSLRADIYQPLYRESSAIELSLQANNMRQEFSSQTFDLLNQNGNLGRVPKPLREKIVELYQKAGQARSHVIPLAHKISVIMPLEIRKIRTEADHRAWTQKVLIELNAENDLSSGSFPMASFTFKHAGVTPSIDRTDPQHPRIGSPGSITWQVNDWMKFPRSASDVESIWPSTWFLCFDEYNEYWDYVIIRDDLTRNHMRLEQFLRPVYDKLSLDPEFEKLLQDNQSALGLLGQVKPSLAARVEQPKQLRDLIDFF